MVVRLVALGIAVGGLGRAAVADSRGPTRAITSLIEDHIDSGLMPGAAVTFVQDGQIVYAGGFGHVTPGGPPVTSKTVFSIGSVTKPYVAHAILRLAADGSIERDTPVASFFPDSRALQQAGDGLRIQQLLNHTSGWTRWTGNRNQSATSSHLEALQQSLGSLPRPDPLNFGTHEYSNANYQVLGAIIERVTGVPFARSMEALLFGPFGLRDTYVGYRAGAPDTARGHRYVFFSLQPYSEPLGAELEPQGGISTTARDLGRFLQKLTSEPGDLGEWRETWDRASPTGRPGVRYGDGWLLHGTRDDPIALHHGLNPGFSAAIALAPGRKTGVGVLINASDGFLTGDVNGLLDQVLATVFPELPVHRVDHAGARRQLVVLFVIALVTLFWIVCFARRMSGADRLPVGWLRIVLPSLVLAALALAIGFLLPRALGIPISGIIRFSPDIGWVLLLLTCLLGGWAVVRVLLLFAFSLGAGVLGTNDSRGSEHVP